MRIIEGFESAKSALTRKNPVEAYTVPAEVGQKLQKMFRTDDPEQAVRKIINDVRGRGDAALFDLTLKIDRQKLTALEISKEQVSNAYREINKKLVSALKLAAKRINSFHRTQKDNIWHEFKKANLRQMIRPLQRVGVYAPGGTASYPSTVLMTAIPAKVAGVSEIILVTPPRQDGAVPPATLVAADIAGVDRIFNVGGAQAIAALAFGTESIPAVDKICGPGNIFVVLAKKMVYGVVDIDGLQGPSEVFIIADETANPGYCAADLLAQAEHDTLVSCILVTTTKQFAHRVIQEVARQQNNLSRQAVAAASLEKGLIIVVDNVDEAIALANLYAPEHLLLMMDRASSYLDKINNAGCIITGVNATVVLGDYMAGPSHVLPTAGTARFGSPLNVGDFLKFINVIEVDEAILKKLGPAAAVIARAEGLDAHARAVEQRLKQD